MNIIDKIVLKAAQKDKERVAREDVEHHERFVFPQNVREEPTALSYTTREGETFHIDVYQPVIDEDKLPILVDIHGGGLMFASTLTNRDFCARMAEKGFLVFCPEYPLIPSVNAFSQMAAVISAMNAIDEVIDKYKGDRERVYMAGDSAGAYLVAYAVAICNNHTLSELLNISPSCLPVKKLGLICGMYYTHLIDKNGLFMMRSLMYGKGKLRKVFKPYMNPDCDAVAGSLPVSMLITTNGDFLQSYTERFYKVLSKHDSAHKIVNVQEALYHVFNVLDTDLPASRDVNQKLADFFLYDEQR